MSTLSPDDPDDPDDTVTAAPEMNASRLLRIRAVWISPLVIASVLISLMTLVYVGSVVDPLSHLHGLPVLVVNEDQGARVGSQHVDVGQEVVAALEHTPAVSSRLSLDSYTMAQAKTELDKNAAYAAILVPQGFTKSLVSLYSAQPPERGTPPLPTIQLLTNERSGSVGVSLASGVATPALQAISLAIGQHLEKLLPVPGTTSASEAALRVHPVEVVTVPYRPVPSHSALGLSAFYVSLLTIMCGFLGAILVNSTLDSALGYATTEIGPKWSQRAPLRISRWQTLLAKWLMALVLVPILTALLLVVAIGILHMDAPYAAYLWLFSSFAAVVIALGTLVLFAALGALGQLVAMLLFVYLALASSGGTIPLQALPNVLKFAANFEPLRQVLDGVRAILYFNAQGDAGLTRGVVMTSLGLILWLVLGIAITVWYDRRNLDRMQPEVLAYIHRSVRLYNESQDIDHPPPILNEP
ncbi:MAG: YhgE/Pip domain-containing protein [Acidimicrobiales bacterium]